jgi:hypothetical protein
MSLYVVNRYHQTKGELWVAVIYPKASPCGANPGGPWAKAGWWRVFPYVETPLPYRAEPYKTPPTRILKGDLSPRFYYYIHARAWDGSKWVAGWGDKVSAYCPLYTFRECMGTTFRLIGTRDPDPAVERCWFLELYTHAKDLVLTLHA